MAGHVARGKTIEMGILKILNKPNIQILQAINVNDIDWCDEAVLIRVKNGKGTLTRRVGEEDDEYMEHSQLLLNGKPIIQGKYPVCPTCEGMLATGYGTENIHSEELERVRECMNSEYKGLEDSAEKIKPLLGLLNDGYYVLADVKLYPSNGKGGFFYSVPNELTYNEATCNEFYDIYYHSSIEGYPAYIFPTQSIRLINKERVKEYIEQMQSDSTKLRGLAFYERGFMCALLDGHHKACAASALGKTLGCITIISPDRYYFKTGAKYSDKNPLIEKVGFGGIVFDAWQGAKFEDLVCNNRYLEKDHPLPLYDLVDGEIPDCYINRYPTPETLSKVGIAEIDVKADVTEYAKKLIDLHDEESAIKLNYLMKYISETHKEEAYSIAKLILDEEDELYLKQAQKSAIEEMLMHRNEEAEQYMIKYLADHNSKDRNWDLVSSYWKD